MFTCVREVRISLVITILRLVISKYFSPVELLHVSWIMPSSMLCFRMKTLVQNVTSGNLFGGGGCFKHFNIALGAVVNLFLLP
jgi:hypothetical protein